MKPWLRFFLGGLLGVLTIAGNALAQQQPVMTVSMTQVAVLTGGTPPGEVALIILTNGGTGYTVVPNVAFSGGGGTLAAAVATISSSGSVSNIIITSGGSGYSSAPTITIDPPSGSTIPTPITATAKALVGTVFPQPTQNESYGKAGTSIALTALAVGTFPASGFTYEFFANGISLGIAAATPPAGTPASIGWNPPQPGSYFLTVTATDGAHTATSLPVRYFATGTMITSPTPNTIVPNGSSVVLQATSMPQPLTGAGSTDTFVSRIEFWADGVLIPGSSDNTAPYSFIYTPTTAVSHTIQAKAYDNQIPANLIPATVAPGLQGDTLTLYMVPPIGTPPTCVISSPANNAILPIPSSTSGDIPVAVSAGSPTGLITKVELYIDGTLFGTATTFPYSFTWHPTVVGGYKLIALAYDDKSNVVASSTTTLKIAASPTVTMVTPVAGSSAGVSTPVTLTAAATDSNVGGGIAKVQFFADGVFVGETNTATSGNQYTFSWTPTSAGAASITALAINNLGLSSMSSAVAITITAGGGGGGGGIIGVPPTVSITTPTSSTQLPVNIAAQITANAADTDGNVASVQFFVNNQSLSTTTSYPYNATWTPTNLGAYALTAKATDNAGNTVTSTAVSVTVVAPAASLPSVTMAAPATGSTVPLGIEQTLQATAIDSVGVASVQFFVNGQPQGALITSFPFVTTWKPTTPGVYTITARAINFGGNQATSGPSTVTVTGGLAPTVSISSPAAGSVPVNATQTITAAAVSTGGTIASVQFFVNGISLATDTSFPYSTTWTPTALGTYTLQARATDDRGNITNAATVTMTVVAGAPPTVALTNPLAGSSYGVGTAVNFAATAADADGTIAQVQFFVNNIAQGTAATAAPYSGTWTPTSAGTYSITARATDNSGNITTSTALTVTITANGAPTVSLVSPANGATASAGTVVTLTASAADADGTVTSVRFLVNGFQVAPAVVAVPFSTAWTPTAVGTYTIVAEATDNTGNVTSSAPRTISVIANQPPTVALTSPANNSSLPAGEPITVTATASDSDGTVASVRFILNGNVLVDATGKSDFITAPYTFTLILTTPGSYSLVAEATDNVGNITDSVARTVTIVANQPPKVTLTSPTSGFLTTLGLTVNFAATASDQDGTITSVRFLANGSSVGSGTAPVPPSTSWTATWTPTSASTYSVVAEATDDVGNVSTSAPATVTILANLPPSIALTAPANGSVVRVGTTTNLIATATDSDGTIASVQFLVNDAAVGSPVAAFPYRTPWTPAAEGIYRITATAVDNAGASTTSAATTVLVVSAASGGDTVYTGSFFGIGEAGRFAVISVSGKNAAFIGYSTLGAGKVYFYPSIPVDASHGFTLTDATGRVLVAGNVSDTAATVTTLDGAPITLIGIVSFPAGTSVASGYYTGSLSGRPASQLAAIVGPDGSIMLFATDGSVRTAGAGVVSNSGTFSVGIPSVLGGGLFSGQADPATNFLSGNLTGPLAGGIMGAVESGVSFSDGFLRNLSSRGQVGTGSNVLIAGFVVGGTTPKQVLIRAIGPSLTQFGITGALADTQLQLYGGQNTNALIASNKHWGGTVALYNAANTVGAFPLSPTSFDSALLVTLTPGNYSAQVSGVGGTTGTALVELYDVDNPTPYSSQKIINISTSALVGTGQNNLIAGFVVNGTTAKKLLIRAVGPSLAPYVVPGTALLADPFLRIIQIRNTDNLVVRENDNWETGNDISLVSAAAVSAGAFPLAAGGKDAAILITLPPGSYSAQVTGSGATTGIALVEVYEVP